MILPGGMHAAVGHAADASQLLQPEECSWQHCDQDDNGSAATGTGASVEANRDTPDGHQEQQCGTEQGSSRWTTLQLC